MPEMLRMSIESCRYLDLSAPKRQEHVHRCRTVETLFSVGPRLQPAVDGRQRWRADEDLDTVTLYIERGSDVVVSDLRGAKNWNESGSGERRSPGLLTSNRRRRDELEGEPMVDCAGVCDLRDGGSGYTTPAGMGASSYRPPR